MNEKRVKRIRKEVRKRGLDWREKLYEIIRVPSMRHGASLQARLKPGTGRQLYHRIKDSVQANRP